MKIDRRIVRLVAVLGLAAAAGQLVQSKSAPQHNASLVPAATGVALPDTASPLPVATGVTLVAAGPSEPVPVLRSPVEPALPPQALLPEPEPAPALAAPLPASDFPDPAQVVDACPVHLDLLLQDHAMIGLSVLAPCHPDQRIVLRHAGLAITGQTSASGAMFASVPAMDQAGRISLLFADGSTAEAALPVPDLAALRRFAVQWQADDAFQIHAFENGADYGQPGHVWAAAPQLPPPGVPTTGGFLTSLGDAGVTLPLLAEVYTFPATTTQTPTVVVEAAVSDMTCGRELLGETLVSSGGAVTVTDLTVAMPDCTGLGDILVLKNLVPDLTLAAAN